MRCPRVSLTGPDAASRNAVLQRFLTLKVGRNSRTRWHDACAGRFDHFSAPSRWACQREKSENVEMTLTGPSGHARHILRGREPFLRKCPWPHAATDRGSSPSALAGFRRELKCY